MKKPSDFIVECEKLIGKEVKITLTNGVNLYGILYECIPSGKLGNSEDEIYINSKGNIMGLLKNRIKAVVENI